MFAELIVSDGNTFLCILNILHLNFHHAVELFTVA